MSVDFSFFSESRVCDDDDDGGDGGRWRPMGLISWVIVGPPAGGGGDGGRWRLMGSISSSLFKRDSGTGGDEVGDDHRVGDCDGGGGNGDRDGEGDECGSPLIDGEWMGNECLEPPVGEGEKSEGE